MNKKIGDDIVGFDEMAVEANANTARLWSFGTVRRVATYVKSKAVGFYSLNGESIIDLRETSQKILCPS